MIVVLKQINELDNVLVLAHLENFYLPSLLVHFYRLHVCLGDDFYSKVSTILLVRCKFNDAELALAQVFVDGIEVINVGETDFLSDGVSPHLLKCLWSEVENSWLVWRNNDSDWIQVFFCLGINLCIVFLYVSTSQTMHDSCLRIKSLAVAQEIFTLKHSPVLFKVVWSCFQHTGTFKLFTTLPVLLFTEWWDDDIVLADLLVKGKQGKISVRGTSSLLRCRNFSKSFVFFWLWWTNHIDLV